MTNAIPGPDGIEFGVNPVAESSDSAAAEVATVEVSALPPIRIKALRLVGPRRDYLVDFTHSDSDVARQLSIIAGEISTGKTSILELIDFCLGAKHHPEHDEIVANVRTVQLSIEVRESRIHQSEDTPSNADAGVRESPFGVVPEDHRLVLADQDDSESSAELPREHVAVHYVIERSLNSTLRNAWLYRGDHRGVTADPPEKLSLDPAEPDSLSQFLLRACGLAGLRVKDSPTQEESKTSILSFRDVQPLWFLTNRRMDNGDLVLEKSPPRTLKLRQVVDYFFGVNDDESSAIAQQIEQLRRELNEGKTTIAALRKFLADAGISDIATVDEESDRLRIEFVAARVELEGVTSRLAASTQFAAEMRSAYHSAAQQARRLESQSRERQTLLSRLEPLRSQYADDLRKLDMLQESQRVFDALSVTVCPACQARLSPPVSEVDGHCSLCNSSLPAHEGHASDFALAGSEDDELASGDMSNRRSESILGREQRSVRSRISQLKDFIGEVSQEANALGEQLSQSQRDVESAQAALDEATAAVIAPFIVERDALISRISSAESAIAYLAKTKNMLLQLQQRENHVLQTAGALREALDRQKNLEQTRQSRDGMIARLSKRFELTLAAFGYPKLDQVHLYRNLIPVVRGHRYDRVGSSGAMTLIALAWQLSIFEEAVENGVGHPGFLLIDSPQKNLRPVSGVRPASAGISGSPKSSDENEILAASDSIVERIYAHIQSWLAMHPAAQIIIVDNEPPSQVRADIVVTYSANADEPPYGLIDDADGSEADDASPGG